MGSEIPRLATRIASLLFASFVAIKRRLMNFHCTHVDWQKAFVVWCGVEQGNLACPCVFDSIRESRLGLAGRGRVWTVGRFFVLC